MFISDWPRTKEQAASTLYRVWAGNPAGNRWRESRCAASVPDGGRSPLSHQCQHKPGNGPDGLYCGRHAKMVESHPPR